MAQEYKILTIRDLENIITQENAERFKADFCRWLDVLVRLKELHKILPGVVSYNEEAGFRWIDDGREDSILEVAVK